jgi:hypothetical protein
MVISLGRNDVGSLIDSMTPTAWKTAFSEYIDFLFTDFENLERVYLRVMGRHPDFLDAADEAKWEAIRDIHYELAQEKANVYVMPENYDLTMNDNSHLGSAAMQIEMDRNAKKIAYVNGKYNKPMTGMKITGAMDDANGVLATITHSDGTDFIIPETPDTSSLFRIEYDGGQVADLSSVDLLRISSNQILIETGALVYPEKLHVMYGRMSGIATDVTPQFPKDNSPNQLPLTRSKVLITGGANAIDDITNLDFYLRPDASKTYSTGTKVATVADEISGTWTNWIADAEMNFDAAAFGGLGGFTSTGTSNRLKKDVSWAGTMFIATCLTIPSILSGTSVIIWQGGTANTATSVVQANLQTNGSLQFSQNQVNANQNFGGDYRGGTYVFVFNFTSDASCDIYVYDKNGLVAQHNFDPRNSYTSRTELYYGGSIAGTVHGIMLGKNEAHSISDPSIGAIANYMLREQNSLL